MGLIKALTSAAGGVLADQWKEFFYCDAMDNSVLVTKGVKRTNGNNRGNDNIISNGSGIAVADGQCMIIVDQGKVAEICAEPGQFTYDSSSEPSIFTGNLGEAITETFKAIGKRFTFGGDTGKDQRVYYFNTKEIIDNKFGTPNPIPFRVVDKKIGLDIDVSLRCSGVYSYRITDPILFYTNICGNVANEYRRDEIDNTLKTEFISALAPALAKYSHTNEEIRPYDLPMHNTEIADIMQKELSEKWSGLRGISVISVALGTVTLPPEDEKMIKEAQRNAINMNPGMAAATLVGAQAEAMKAAANNASGAMNGFVGMNMAGAAGGINASDLFAMNASKPAPAADSWTCSCGSVNQGKFCANCGAAKPAPAAGWTCSCGSVNQGRFCANCGAKKPEGALLYKCDNCGWVPEDPSNPPKFCPQCGDPFNEKDVQ